MKSFISKISLFIFIFSLLSCDSTSKENDNKPPIEAPEGMVWVPSKTFTKGAKPNDEMAMKAEKPAQQVYVDGFFIDAIEVTNQNLLLLLKQRDIKP